VDASLKLPNVFSRVVLDRERLLANRATYLPLASDEDVLLDHSPEALQADHVSAEEEEWLPIDGLCSERGEAFEAVPLL